MEIGKFVEIDGLIHLVLDSDNTICCTATADAADTEGDERLRWKATRKSVVTCPVCADIVRICRDVLIRSLDRVTPSQ